MKRSEINQLITDATACFVANGWALPPNPSWDVTDFGSGNWQKYGLVLVNLTDEPEYCEKLMYAKKGMITPMHWHLKKKEDIICRAGVLRLTVGIPSDEKAFRLKRNGVTITVQGRETIKLVAGERVTLEPHVKHAFEAVSDECIIGEVSTANDDLNDNVFFWHEVGRYSIIEEDVPATVRLLSDD